MRFRKRKHIAVFEIFLLVSCSFAVAFIVGENFAEATTGLGDPFATISPKPVSVTSGAPASSVSYPWETSGGYDTYASLPDAGTGGGAAGSGAATGGAGGSGAGGAGTGTGAAGGTGGGVGGGAAGSGAAGGTGSAGPGFMDSLFGGQGFGGGVGGALFSGLVWGAAVFGISYFVAGMFGLNKDQSLSIAAGLGAGTFVGASLYLYGQTTVLPGLAAGQTLPFAFSGFGAALIGVGVAAAVILLTYKKEKKELVRFECFAWEAPTGGSRCEDCNNDPLRPCSEYRCKSLGQGCNIVNPGTKEEKCVWVSKGDTAAPHIEPLLSALKPTGLRYDPDATISPPNRGFRINDNEGIDECLPAFTKFTFGFTTDEPAQCKVDLKPSDNYDEMSSYFVGNSNLFLEEHTQQLKTMNTAGEEGELVPEIGVDGTFTLWVRCIDANGNGKDSAMVAFRYCVDQGPDEIAPLIEGTDITTGSPVRFNADSVPIEVYTNEPAECKWSRQDKAFDAMENAMECSKETFQINANLDYVCSGDLTGIENREDNWFYFRCKDRKGNIMTTSYPLLLKGTEELTIQSVGPTGTFVGSTTVIPVTLSAETAHGAKDGEAVCSFSSNPTDSTTYVAMDNTGMYLHNQTLDLGAGSYVYWFRCIDAGGNLAMANTTFNVTVDTIAPRVTRVFKDANVLKVITNEEAKCYYSNTNCNYDVKDGLVMMYEDSTKRNIHSVEWKETVTYYIKCEDFQGNRGRPDACQVITKASEL